VAQLLLDSGPASAATLGAALGLSPTAVRRHLDTLTSQGRVESRQPRSVGPRGRGRPARVFALTEAGRASFPHAYDDLAAAALTYLAEAGGPGAVEEFAARRAAGIQQRHGAAVAAAEDSLQALAEALTGEGYAATTAAAPGGAQLCQHHCPVAAVAARFPELCVAETAALSSLLGTHVQRLATIAHGDGVCTTSIPLATATGSPS